MRACRALMGLVLVCCGNSSSSSSGDDASTSSHNDGAAPDDVACSNAVCFDASDDNSTIAAPDGSGGPLEAAVKSDAGGMRGWDWNGVVGTGQSLSVGAQASTAMLTTQPFHNLKLSLGSAKVTVPPYNPNDPALAVVPLVELIRAAPSNGAYPSAYPLNIYGETPHTAMGDQISSLNQHDTGKDYVSVHTVVGEAGQGIGVINKTAMVTPTLGHAYAATLFEVTALARLAKAAGKTYGVSGIILTHGETDGGNPNYEADVYQLLTDYNADIAAITGQKEKVPLFLTQQQTSPQGNGPPASLLAEWKIALDHPGEAVCVGPKYQYPYATDHLHLVALGYDELGEKYGEVYYDKVVLGHDWQPLQPTSATLNGTVITVKFHVPIPPLAWDTALPMPHQTANTAWANGKGFEVLNQGGPQTITSVAIQGDSVLIALASAPAPTGLLVQYAVTQDGTNGTYGGQAAGRIGQLRDSDPLVGYATKMPLYNYAVSFQLPVN